MVNYSTKQALILIAYGVLIGLIAGGLIWITASPPVGIPIMLAASSTASPITVYVSGEVVNPGVYKLPQGSRVQDAINSAGGFLLGADTESINLAALITDSSQINIPSTLVHENYATGKVNINSAEVDELDKLPGIGPTTARNIIEYRRENGPFTYLEDIQKVPGIGPATYENIKNLISLGD